MIYTEYYLEDIPKYKKKSKKKNNSANHKHDYKTVLIQNSTIKSVYLGKICNVCGKIKIVEWFISERVEQSNCFRVLLDLENIKRVYPDLEVVEKE